MALSRDQRNEVLRRIEARALSREDFRWDDATSGNRTVVGPVEHHALAHRATGVLFTFKSQPSEFEAPANGITLAGGSEVGVPRINVINGWPKQIDGFSEWLDRLRDELGVPDLWAELVHDDRAVFTVVADPSAENTPFADGEREEIARALAELTTEVKGFFRAHGELDQDAGRGRGPTDRRQSAHRPQGLAAYVHRRDGVHCGHGVDPPLAAGPPRGV